MSERALVGAVEASAPKTEADPRVEQVASLHVTLRESEGDYTFIGYASNPRENSDYWIIHVVENGKILYDTKIPRLDGGTFSHHDLTLLGNEVDRLKRIFSADIHTAGSVEV